MQVPELIHNKMCLTGFRAESKEGKWLGQVEDFVFDITTSEITSYYIKPQTLGPSRVGQDLILPARLVIEIQPHKIIFADSNLIPKAAMAGLAKAIE
jgi:sporulation protein YlmC with PRC-barrel domain